MISGLPVQFAGLVLAGTTIMAIGAGHVLVRRLHARFGTSPAIPFILLGLLVLVASLATRSHLLSGVLGITAVTLIWDGIEFPRQEKRIRLERIKGIGDG